MQRMFNVAPNLHHLQLGVVEKLLGLSYDLKLIQSYSTQRNKTGFQATWFSEFSEMQISVSLFQILFECGIFMMFATTD
jgi:hypothetical protein